MLSLNPRAASPPDGPVHREVKDSKENAPPAWPSASSASSSSTAVVVRPPDNKLVSKYAAMKKKGSDSARNDKPLINYQTRGNKQYALKVAEGPHLLESAVRKYDKDTKSAGDTSD